MGGEGIEVFDLPPFPSFRRLLPLGQVAYRPERITQGDSAPAIAARPGSAQSH